MPHQRLLLKLKAHGIGNDVINWIEEWLTHRRQRVIVDGEISNWKTVLNGVPQGSVLCPILFLIYINDDISSKVQKFADDTKVFRKVSVRDKHNLQDDLDKLVKWSEKWQMNLLFGMAILLNLDKPQLRISRQWFNMKTLLSTHHLYFMGRAILSVNTTSRVSNSSKMKVYLYTPIPIFVNAERLCCLCPNSTYVT